MVLVWGRKYLQWVPRVVWKAREQLWKPVRMLLLLQERAVGVRVHTKVSAVEEVVPLALRAVLYLLQVDPVG